MKPANDARLPAQPSLLRWAGGWLITALLAALLVATAMLAQITFQESRTNVIRLSGVELPLLQEIQALDLLLIRAQSNIYEYYLTADGVAFQSQFHGNNKELEDRYRRLALDAPQAPALPGLASNIDELRRLGTRFDQVMQTSPIDWDRAREVLDSLGPLTTALNEQTQALSGWIGNRIAMTSRESLAKLSRTLTLLAAALAVSLAGALTLLWVNRDRLAAMKTLRFRAQHDSTTGLRNRRAFHDDAGHQLMLESPERYQVALIKLDRLQDVVARGGLGLGDAVINEAVKRMTAVIEAGACGDSILYRIDGNLFALLFETRSLPAAVTVGRLLSAFALPLVAAGNVRKLTLSLGVAPLQSGEDSSVSTRDPVERVLINADAALRLAQHRGGNEAVFFDEALADKERRRRALKATLPAAITEEEFSIHYQPQFEARSGQLSGVEALLRWDSRELGPVAPGEFIPIAEEDLTIIELGAWVIANACRDAGRWRHLASPPRLAVNLSARQLEQARLVELVKDMLNLHQLAPARVELEITESAMLTPSAETQQNLHELRALGVELSVDDFGTGYSSLSYLHRLPVQRLKIDRAFVSGIDTDERLQASVKAIIALAKAHDLETVAEGVETQDELLMLQRLGVDQLQGYLLGKPMALDAFLRLLSTSNPEPECRRADCSPRILSP